MSLVRIPGQDCMKQSARCLDSQLSSMTMTRTPGGCITPTSVSRLSCIMHMLFDASNSRGVCEITKGCRAKAPAAGELPTTKALHPFFCSLTLTQRIKPSSWRGLPFCKVQEAGREGHDRGHSVGTRMLKACFSAR